MFESYACGCSDMKTRLNSTSVERLSFCGNSAGLVAFSSCVVLMLNAVPPIAVHMLAELMHPCHINLPDQCVPTDRLIDSVGQTHL